MIRNTFRFSIRNAIMMVAIAAVRMDASTTYYYSGNAFTQTPSPFAPSDYLTGSFTSSTLAAGLYFSPIAPTSYTFKDQNGIVTLTDTNSQISLFAVSTNGNGQITMWSIFLTYGPLGRGIPIEATLPNNTNITPASSPDESTFPAIWTFNFGPGFTGAQDIIDFPYPTPTAGSGGVPGNWTASSVPEPSTIILTSTALLALGFARRKVHRPEQTPFHPHFNG